MNNDGRTIPLFSKETIYDFLLFKHTVITTYEIKKLADSTIQLVSRNWFQRLLGGEHYTKLEKYSIEKLNNNLLTTERFYRFLGIEFSEIPAKDVLTDPVENKIYEKIQQKFIQGEGIKNEIDDEKANIIKNIIKNVFQGGTPVPAEVSSVGQEGSAPPIAGQQAPVSDTLRDRVSDGSSNATTMGISDLGKIVVGDSGSPASDSIAQGRKNSVYSPERDLKGSPAAIQSASADQESSTPPDSDSVVVKGQESELPLPSDQESSTQPVAAAMEQASGMGGVNQGDPASFGDNEGGVNGRGPPESPSSAQEAPGLDAFSSATTVSNVGQASVGGNSSKLPVSNAPVNSATTRDERDLKGSSVVVSSASSDQGGSAEPVTGGVGSIVYTDKREVKRETSGPVAEGRGSVIDADYLNFLDVRDYKGDGSAPNQKTDQGAQLGGRADPDGHGHPSSATPSGEAVMEMPDSRAADQGGSAPPVAGPMEQVADLNLEAAYRGVPPSDGRMVSFVPTDGEGREGETSSNPVVEEQGYQLALPPDLMDLVWQLEGSDRDPAQIEDEVLKTSFRQSFDLQQKAMQKEFGRFLDSMMMLVYFINHKPKAPPDEAPLSDDAARTLKSEGTPSGLIPAGMDLDAFINAVNIQETAVKGGEETPSFDLAIFKKQIVNGVSYKLDQTWESNWVKNLGNFWTKYIQGKIQSGQLDETQVNLIDALISSVGGKPMIMRNPQRIAQHSVSRLFAKGLLTDREAILRMAQINPNMLLIASKEVLNDPNFALDAMKIDFEYVYKIDFEDAERGSVCEFQLEHKGRVLEVAEKNIKILNMVSESLWQDPEFVQAARNLLYQVKPEKLKEIESEFLWKDEDFVKHAWRVNPELARSRGNSYQWATDQEFILEIAGKSPNNILDRIHKDLWNNKDFVKRLIKIHPPAIEHLKRNLLVGETQYTEGSPNGSSLNTRTYVISRWKRDLLENRDLLLLACEQDIDCASHFYMRGNEGYENLFNFQLNPPITIFEDVNFYLKFADKFKEQLVKYCFEFPKKIAMNPDFFYEAIKIDYRIIQSINVNLLMDIEFLKQAKKIDQRIFEVIDGVSSLRRSINDSRDRNFIMYIASEYPKLLQFSQNVFLKEEAFVKEIINRNPRALNFLVEWKYNKKFVIHMLYVKPECLQYSGFQNSADFMEREMSFKPELLQYSSLATDTEFMTRMVRTKPNLLRYSPLAEDPKFIPVMMNIYPTEGLGYIEEARKLRAADKQAAEAAAARAIKRS